MDTYKVATVANSTSTMHKLSNTPITKECFSFDEDLDGVNTQNDGNYFSIGKMNDIVIEHCEFLRKLFLETKDKRYWRALIQLLPESWNQTRTWTANYQTLQGIYKWRHNHKLIEWREFCKMIKTLPYGKELICYQGE